MTSGLLFLSGSFTCHVALPLAHALTHAPSTACPPARPLARSHPSTMMHSGVQSTVGLAVSEQVPKPTRRWSLQAEHELRIEVEFLQSLQLRLLSGRAEIFGTELASHRDYSFRGEKFAVFTWHGAEIELVGECHSYKATETPMVMYANVHAALEELRAEATERLSFEPRVYGPRVMVVGPTVWLISSQLVSSQLLMMQ